MSKSIHSSQTDRIIAGLVQALEGKSPTERSQRTETPPACELVIDRHPVVSVVNRQYVFLDKALITKLLSDKEE